MKVVNCTKCNEEYAIDLNKPEEWYCPYCDNLYSVTTDKLSVEKLQEQLNNAKKALTEMRNAFGGATFIDSKNKLHSVSEYVSNVLAAIGGDDEQSN